ncbi:right-handed parallel beta-helix repeat-containing protein [Chitinophaga sp. Ak27]|uniref:right-handed parallel beta-helix repeat-containing protein n=1 Tax=Chitinophaga sp. Ak27 TaxID=2726116 RepID=UPI00145CE1A8|nr:right-handed parallel beta-helix repeat-containing protein [Chitinophaga sp. Ak27]NLU91929.1 right-handed parallel beta-helix repeat-containing protein [Chitinophaga sp. Ak27]
MRKSDLLLRKICSLLMLLCILYTAGCHKPDKAGPKEDPGGKDNGEANVWPSSPPAEICGNTQLLTGPGVAPPGAIIVQAGNNSNVNFKIRGATYWFAPGVHTIGGDKYSQIIPEDSSTFIGGPGAILDGQNINHYAFTQRASNVTIRYLTIRNFVAPRDEGVVNHDAGNKWTIEYNTISNNKGAGLMAGPNNIYRYNCIKDNGQYGINSCCGTELNEVENFVLDHNEITGNNTDDWEKKIEGCGCTGGAKFWINKNVMVTNNWVHHNKGVGLWLDNNNRGFVIENNYINDNDGNGLMIEAGYDARVRFNNFKKNAIVAGMLNMQHGDNFPVPAIYISEAGSPRGFNLKTSPMLISKNNFENNWGGVVLWENPNRYSGSSGNTHIAGTIKIKSLYDDSPCKSGVPNTIPGSVPDKFACRWSTENIIVENNEFRIDKAMLGYVGGNFCGINGIFSEYGSFPEFSGYVIPWRITFQQDNVFRNNHYYGDWQFAGFEVTNPDGSRVSWKNWTAPAPPVPDHPSADNRPITFGQDKGSTYVK